MTSPLLGHGTYQRWWQIPVSAHLALPTWILHHNSSGLSVFPRYPGVCERCDSLHCGVGQSPWRVGHENPSSTPLGWVPNALVLARMGERHVQLPRSPSNYVNDVSLVLWFH